MKTTVERILNRTPVGRFARSTIRYTGTGFLVPERLKAVLGLPFEATVQLPGGRSIRMQSEGDDEVVHRLHWHGLEGYEPEATELFHHISARSRCVLDVGAHGGLYALLAAAANPESRVHAFEPMSAVYDRLQANVRRNRTERIACVRAAVADADGAVDLHVPTGRLPTSASTRPGFRTASRVERVRTVRLDTYVGDRTVPCVDLVKIDTESTEHRVLEGMQAVLSEHAPIILSEVLHGRNEREQQAVLERAGYRWYWLTDEGPIPTERIVGDATYRFKNYLYVPGRCPSVRSRIPDGLHAVLGF